MFSQARSRLALAALFIVAATAAGAQQTAPAATAYPEMGAMAPDFALPGATRYGLLRDPVHLSDFRGKTVVLAFFYRARTKG
jgi:peroxiredoxin Q/BCP